MNYSVFAWDLSKSPGWRPSFKYYSPWLSLFATVQSVVLMFLIDWLMALVTMFVGVVCWMYIDHREVDVDWGTTVESQLYRKSCKMALKYQRLHAPHAKTTRPTFLMLMVEGLEQDVQELFEGVDCLNYSDGLIFIAHVMPGSLEDMHTAKRFMDKRQSLKNYKGLTDDILRRCIMETIVADDHETGAKHIMQSAGMGGVSNLHFIIFHFPSVF